MPLPVKISPRAFTPADAALLADDSARRADLVASGRAATWAFIRSADERDMARWAVSAVVEFLNERLDAVMVEQLLEQWSTRGLPCVAELHEILMTLQWNRTHTDLGNAVGPRVEQTPERRASDRRDARALARLLRAGRVNPVLVKEILAAWMPRHAPTADPDEILEAS